MKQLFILLMVVVCLPVSAKSRKNAKKELWPDGSSISEWFFKTDVADTKQTKKNYVITDFGVVNDSTIVQTNQIQSVIDQAASEGGGVIIIPEGTYLSGALFFKPNTHLYVSKEGVLKGSDDICDFPPMDSRMEGQNLKYFPALVNVYNVDGFTLTGEGIINGNGLRYWKSFWQRRSVIPKCTNMDELRPRLLFVWNSNDVQIANVKLVNSPFWTTHFYKCNNVKLLNLHIYSPSKPVKAPSTDAVDIDVCNNFLIKNCYMSVNDDAVAIKGGKGPWADKDDNNGANTNILIEDCTYDYCHGALTLGSESIYDKNIILRRCLVNNPDRLLWLKMRPDTPQTYEYILVEDIKGNGKNFIYIKPWSQFFDLKGREDMPKSYSNNVVMRNIDFECNVFFNVDNTDQYELKDFTFENLTIKTDKGNVNKDIIKNFIINNVSVNGEKID